MQQDPAWTRGGAVFHEKKIEKIEKDIFQERNELRAKRFYNAL